MTGFALFAAVFLACTVEAVEALTIILAAGTARDWRSAFKGMAAALAVLVVIVVVLGPAVTALPLAALRLVVGGLLLVFGIGWLRKAVLRASGNKALHDEDAAYAQEVQAARAATGERRPFAGDWYAFTLSFKGVLLEGLEVVFIALTFGSNQHDIPLASVGAVAAVALVAIAGLAVRHPLSRVPENTMKFAVGVMLTSSASSGAPRSRRRMARLGRRAPGHHPSGPSPRLSLRRCLPGREDTRQDPRPRRPLTRLTKETQHMSKIKAFGLFWWDFLIGDDWTVAAAVAIGLAVTYFLSHATPIPSWWLMPVVVLAILPVSIRRMMPKR